MKSSMQRMKLGNAATPMMALSINSDWSPEWPSASTIWIDEKEGMNTLVQF